MTQSLVHRTKDQLEYAVRRVLLLFLGPAQLDEEHDPVSQLKRQYHRG